MKNRIRNWALELGFDDCRFTTADTPESFSHFEEWIDGGCHGDMAWMERSSVKRSDLSKVLQGVHSVICLAVSYRQDDSSEPGTLKPEHVGQVARYARYRDYHEALGQKLAELVCRMDAFLKDDRQRSLWYVDTGPILERDLAQRSGIGFIGKHTNLISRKLGNWIFLAEILTPLELEPDQSTRNYCGSCSRCLDVCPTQAITAPFKLDARKCISYLTIEHKGSIPGALRPAIGNRIFGCDDCLEVCPWNRFGVAGRMLSGFRRNDLESPDLLELLELSEDDFRTRFRHTPLFRNKRRRFLRNVCVALGNTAGREALPQLVVKSQGSEPLIAEHAEWAINQIRARCGN